MDRSRVTPSCCDASAASVMLACLGEYTSMMLWLSCSAFQPKNAAFQCETTVESFEAVAHSSNYSLKATTRISNRSSNRSSRAAVAGVPNRSTPPRFATAAATAPAAASFTFVSTAAAAAAALAAVAAASAAGNSRSSSSQRASETHLSLFPSSGKVLRSNW
eukprot:20039-Heterococcus_DN1.PRE.1